MRYSIATINEPFHIRVTTFGEASGVRFQWKFTEITSMIGGLNGVPVLIDERKSNFDAIDAWDLMLARNMLIEKNDALAGTRIAILVGPGPGLDVVNRLRDLVEKDCVAEIEVFEDEDAALGWMQGDKFRQGADLGWVMTVIPFALSQAFIQVCDILTI